MKGEGRPQQEGNPGAHSRSDGATNLRGCISAPVNLFDGSDEKNPAYCADQRYGRDDDESPEKLAGMLENQAGNSGSGNSGEIDHETLEASPASGGSRAGESLRNGPKIRSANTEKNDAQGEGDHGQSGVVNESKANESAGEDTAAGDKRLAHESG